MRNKSLIFSPYDPNDYRVISEREIFHKREKDYFVTQNDAGVLRFRNSDFDKEVICKIDDDAIINWIIQHKTGENISWIDKLLQEDTNMNLKIYMNTI